MTQQHLIRIVRESDPLYEERCRWGDPDLVSDEDLARIERAKRRLLDAGVADTPAEAEELVFGNGDWLRQVEAIERGTYVVECGYCGREVPLGKEEEAPAWSDDEAWRVIEQRHAPWCKWARERAHQGSYVTIDSSDDPRRSHEEWTDLLGQVLEDLRAEGVDHVDWNEYDEGVRGFVPNGLLLAVRRVVAGRCAVRVEAEEGR